MLLTNTAGLPALPLLTGIFTIVSLPVLATKRKVWALLNATPFAPKPGTPVVVRSGLDAHIVPAPPPGPVFQMIPWKESETYTFPPLSNISAFNPADPVTVMKTEEVPVNGSNRRTLPLPKWITRRSWVDRGKGN